MTGIAAIAPTAPVPRDTRAAAPAASAPAPKPLAGPPLGRDEIEPMLAEVTFGEMLSALNPLHHIPVVGWIYRQITGETIQPAFRVLGGLLTGGPIGAIASAVGALAEELIGQVSFGGDEAPAAAPTAVASAAPAAMPTAAPTESRFAGITTAGGTPLQPLPLATRLAARAYPAPVLPLRDAAPPPDPEAGLVPAAAALPSPARAVERPEEALTPEAAAAAAPAAAPAPYTPSRIRRAPVVPITSGGQDPAFVQKMMQGLEAYDRAMRSRAPAATTRPAAVMEGAAP